MDTLTQAALGAAIGQAGFRRFGRRAAAFGAVCGLIPDFDVFLGAGDPWRGLLTHRAESHSLVVLPVLAVPLGALAWRLLGRRGTAREWIHLAFWGLVTHPLLDVCTTYGTQLLAPLSRQRFALDCVAILDPLYTLPMLAAVALGLRKKADPVRMSMFAAMGLVWGLLYLAAGLSWTMLSQRVWSDVLARKGFTPVAQRTLVPPFFPMLRHAVARDAGGRIAVATLVPWAPERSVFAVVESVDDPRATAALASERGQILEWFSGGLLSVTRQDDGTLWLRDHRYGMLRDPTWSPFQTHLPADADPTDLRMQERAQRGDGIDPAAELAFGLSLVTGG